MKKYSNAPKEIADEIRDSVPVSEEEAIGEDWKKLPYGPDPRSSRRKRSPASPKGRVAAPKGAFRRVKVGRLQLEVPASTGEAYTLELVRYLKSFIKNHPIPS